MLLLSVTDTPTTTGLKGIFGKNSLSIFGLFEIESEIILRASITMSIWSLVLHTTKLTKVQKAFFPTKAYIMMLLSTTIAALKRMVILISYFAPSLGLFNLLFHWKAEQIPFSKGLVDTLRKTKFEGEPVDVSEVYRWKGDNAPDYICTYTGLSHGVYFFLFFFIIAFHAYIIGVMKLNSSPSYRKKAHNLEKCLHSLNSINIPTPFEDWDIDSRNADDHRLKFKQVTREMAYTWLINYLFNLMMLCPLLWTGKAPCHMIQALCIICAFSFSCKHLEEA